RTWSPTTRSAARISATDAGRSEAQLAGRQIAHDFFRAAADGVDAHLAVDAFDLRPPRIPGAAEDLGGLARAELEGQRRLNFQHAQVGDRRFAARDAPGHRVAVRARRVDLPRHLDD